MTEMKALPTLILYEKYILSNKQQENKDLIQERDLGDLYRKADDADEL